MKTAPQVEPVTREALIALIDRAVVPQSKWLDRDSAGAQRQLGEARALLLAGCDFRLSDDPQSDDETWWIDITYEGFNYFEIGERTEDTFYIPTAARLAARAGEDWY